jgi:hypothetical protein
MYIRPRFVSQLSRLVFPSHIVCLLSSSSQPSRLRLSTLLHYLSPLPLLFAIAIARRLRRAKRLYRVAFLTALRFRQPRPSARLDFAIRSPSPTTTLLTPFPSSWNPSPLRTHTDSPPDNAPPRIGLPFMSRYPLLFFSPLVVDASSSVSNTSLLSVNILWLASANQAGML